MDSAIDQYNEIATIALASANNYEEEQIIAQIIFTMQTTENTQYKQMATSAITQYMWAGISEMGLNIHQVLKQIVSNKSFSIKDAREILTSPEFIAVKEQYIKCGYITGSICFACALYSNNRHDILEILADFMTFDISDHYQSLFKLAINEGNIEELNKLYDEFKDKPRFAEEHAKVKRSLNAPMKHRNANLQYWFATH